MYSNKVLILPDQGSTVATCHMALFILIQSSSSAADGAGPLLCQSTAAATAPERRAQGLLVITSSFLEGHFFDFKGTEVRAPLESPSGRFTKFIISGTMAVTRMVSLRVSRGKPWTITTKPSELFILGPS